MIDMTPAANSSTSPVAPPSGVPKSVMIASGIQMLGAMSLIGLLFFEWVQGGNTGLDGSGGGGFGVLALLTAVVTLVAATRGLRGRSAERPILGANQLAIILAIALFFSNLVFLWVFRTGGAPKWVYVVGNLLVYSGVVGLFAAQAEQPEPLDDSKVRIVGAAMVGLGIAIALAPALEYTKLGSRTLTGYEPGAPRIGVLLLLLGGITVFIGMKRAVGGASYADIGPYVLWPHVTIGLGIISAAPALAWMISGLWGNDFDPGIGVYLSIILGGALSAVGWFEASKRGASGR